MDKKMKNEILKLIDVMKESCDNSIDISLRSYTEVCSKLDTLTYLVLQGDKKEC